MTSGRAVDDVTNAISKMGNFIAANNLTAHNN